jgi:hypothetical protein
MINPRRILQRMSSISDKICSENQNIHSINSNFFFPRKSCRLWDNVEESGRVKEASDYITRRMRFAYWVIKATWAHANAPAYPHIHAHTHKPHARTVPPAHAHTQKYVILIAFLQQEWFRDCACMLRDTYSACIVEWYSPVLSVWTRNCCVSASNICRSSSTKIQESAPFNLSTNVPFLRRFDLHSRTKHHTALPISHALPSRIF